MLSSKAQRRDIGNPFPQFLAHSSYLTSYGDRLNSFKAHSLPFIAGRSYWRQVCGFRSFQTSLASTWRRVTRPSPWTQKITRGRLFLFLVSKISNRASHSFETTFPSTPLACGGAQSHLSWSLIAGKNVIESIIYNWISKEELAIVDFDRFKVGAYVSAF